MAERGRCAPCRAEQERTRGRRQQRGYDAEHERVRRVLLLLHIDGTPCRRCGAPMLRGQALDAAHSTDLRDDPTARADHLEHAACNRGHNTKAAT